MLTLTHKGGGGTVNTHSIVIIHLKAGGRCNNDHFISFLNFYLEEGRCQKQSSSVDHQDLNCLVIMLMPCQTKSVD